MYDNILRISHKKDQNDFSIEDNKIVCKKERIQIEFEN